jgi:hypothetical protein
MSLLRCSKSRAPSPSQMVSATSSSEYQISADPPCGCLITDQKSVTPPSELESTNSPRNRIRRARVLFLFEPQRIRNDGRNPRSTAQPSTLARAATGSSADTARRRPSLNPRAIITGIIFLEIGYRYAPSLSWSRAKPRAPVSTSLRTSLAGWRKSPSLAARTLPRALSRSSSVILGWSPSVIAAKGEYAGWRATPATGDFDPHTFAVRAYPVDRSTGCGRDERLY